MNLGLISYLGLLISCLGYVPYMGQSRFDNIEGVVEWIEYLWPTAIIAFFAVLGLSSAKEK